jgi:hypothetical protein
MMAQHPMKGALGNQIDLVTEHRDEVVVQPVDRKAERTKSTPRRCVANSTARASPSDADADGFEN